MDAPHPPQPQHPQHPQHPSDPGIADALQRLEESHGFLDHKVDQLAQQLLQLNRKIDDFSRRLSAFETRIETLAPRPVSPPADQDAAGDAQG